MRISDWSSDVCSSDLYGHEHPGDGRAGNSKLEKIACGTRYVGHPIPINALLIFHSRCFQRLFQPDIPILRCNIHPVRRFEFPAPTLFGYRSEEHTSELQSLMRISYAVFCLKKKNKNRTYKTYNTSSHLLYTR